MNNETPVLYPSIPKHSYPSWVKFFFFAITVLFSFVSIEFIFAELPTHLILSKEVLHAQKTFEKGEYGQAIRLYEKLFEKYPQYKEANMYIAKAYMALSKEDEAYFFQGLFHLNGGTYKQSEINEILVYVPKNFKETFKSLFREKGK